MIKKSMATSVLHITTEVDCKVFLFDEEKGIAIPGKYFNLEVRKGEQNLLFVSTEDENKLYFLLYQVNECDRDYILNIKENDFELLSTEIVDLLRLAKTGKSSSQTQLAYRYYDGNGIKKDLKKAVYWFIKAAEQGDDAAQVRLGTCYVEGIGVERNYEQGLYWIKKAVDQDNAHTKYALGFCYSIGSGVEKDCILAVKWYKKAAEQGFALAQINLAWCYIQGYGVDKDYNEALKWLKKNHRRKDIQAILSLASSYEDGKSKNYNLEDAINLYYIAAQLGDASAIEKTKRIQEKVQESKTISTKVSKDDYVDGFYDEQNVYYGTNGVSLIQCSNLMIKEYQIKNGCQVIKDNAFNISAGIERCSISEAVLPNSITHIGDQAFFGCRELNRVILQEGLVYIGESAFEHCFNLSSISFPSSLVHIGSRAFFACRNLTEIKLPPGLKEIRKQMFGACSNLSKIYFQGTITNIGEGAFSMCNSLTDIIIPSGVHCIGNEAFSMCDNLFSISLPETITHIGDDVFRWCDRLKEIRIPVGSRSKFESLLPFKLHRLLVETNNHYVIQHDSHERLLIKPYYLFFDTETTGVPKDYKAPSSNTNNWPRLVQLGWILTDESGNKISSGNEIINPEGFVIPADASRVHGITTEVALREGKPLRQVVQSFLKDAEGIKCFVGHNVSFDQRVVGAELHRLGIADTVSTARSLDTMIAATDFCKIPGTYGYKWPKLIELHRKLFGCDFEDAHDAMADITATKKCFFEMKRRGLI